MDPHASYVDAWRRRWAELRRQESERAGRARAALPSLVAALRRHGATRVVLFGSLARDRFGLDSDVDLAVAGLEDPEALAVELERASGFRIDLFELESAPPPLAARIAAEGIVLDERAG